MWDSDPHAEYLETEDKGRAIRETWMPYDETSIHSPRSVDRLDPLSSFAHGVGLFETMRLKARQLFFSVTAAYAAVCTILGLS